MPPSTLYHLPDLEEAPKRLLVRDPIVLGNLNTDIGCFRKPTNHQKDKISYVTLDPVADYIYSIINIITPCWLKNSTLLNLLTKISPVISGHPGL